MTTQTMCCPRPLASRGSGAQWGAALTSVWPHKSRRCWRRPREPTWDGPGAALSVSPPLLIHPCFLGGLWAAPPPPDPGGVSRARARRGSGGKEAGCDRGTPRLTSFEGRGPGTSHHQPDSPLPGRRAGLRQYHPAGAGLQPRRRWFLSWGPRSVPQEPRPQVGLNVGPASTLPSPCPRQLAEDRPLWGA